VTALRSVLTNNVNVVIQQSLTMVGSVALMLALNWRLSLFILVLTPIIIGIAAAFSFWLQRTSTRIQDELAGATVVSEEVLQNIREVKSFVREDYEIKRYESAIGRAFDAALLLRRIRSVLGPLIAFLGFGALALILWFGGREVIENRLLVGDLIAGRRPHHLPHSGRDRRRGAGFIHWTVQLGAGSHRLDQARLPDPRYRTGYCRYARCTGADPCRRSYHL